MGLIQPEMFDAEMRISLMHRDIQNLEKENEELIYKTFYEFRKNRKKFTNLISKGMKTNSESITEYIISKMDDDCPDILQHPSSNSESYEEWRSILEKAFRRIYDLERIEAKINGLFERNWGQDCTQSFEEFFNEIINDINKKKEYYDEIQGVFKTFIAAKEMLGVENKIDDEIAALKYRLNFLELKKQQEQ
jgi:hypothetical protein